uniref:Uncharacterized protein n=1 Tax=Meloidogyne enterolobii TaxID=390850 RepID=A0A6V7WWC8_MELEN|nr:unnamed protein product [Meloidogyne enterolobii]
MINDQLNLKVKLQRYITNIYSKSIKIPDDVVPDDHIGKINEYRKEIRSKNKQIKKYEAKKQKNLSKQNEIGDNLRKIYNHVKEAYILAKNGTKIGEINKAKRSKRKRRNYSEMESDNETKKTTKENKNLEVKDKQKRHNYMLRSGNNV